MIATIPSSSESGDALHPGQHRLPISAGHQVHISSTEADQRRLNKIRNKAERAARFISLQLEDARQELEAAQYRYDTIHCNAVRLVNYIEKLGFAE